MQVATDGIQLFASKAPKQRLCAVLHYDNPPATSGHTHVAYRTISVIDSCKDTAGAPSTAAASAISVT